MFAIVAAGSRFCPPLGHLRVAIGSATGITSTSSARVSDTARNGNYTESHGSRFGARIGRPTGLLQIEDCLDANGGIVLPAGVTLISLIDRNIANVGDAVAYRYLDYSRSADGEAAELTWTQLGRRMRAIGARVQESGLLPVTGWRPRSEGLDYVAGFFAAIKAGAIAVPLFAPELQGHAQRLETALRDARPTAVITTAAAADAVRAR